MGTSSCACNLSETPLQSEASLDNYAGDKLEAISLSSIKGTKQESAPAAIKVQLAPTRASLTKTLARASTVSAHAMRVSALTLDTLEPLQDGITVTKYGSVLLESDTRYTGEWNQRSQRHGRGREELPDGSVYTGYFQYDKRIGAGRVEGSDGSVYQGNFDDELPTGIGYYKHADQSEYYGEFVAGLQHGSGTELYPDGSWFEGFFVAGRKQGPGILHQTTGKIYRGHFEDDEINGYGECVWSDCRTYRGPWKHGMMHGKEGYFQWPDGQKYRGDYKRNLKHGKGTLYWPNGRFYSGRWKNGLQHGKGVIMERDDSGTYVPKRGRWYKGQFVEPCS